MPKTQTKIHKKGWKLGSVLFKESKVELKRKQPCKGDGAKLKRGA